MLSHQPRGQRVYLLLLPGVLGVDEIVVDGADVVDFIKGEELPRNWVHRRIMAAEATMNNETDLPYSIIKPQRRFILT